MTAGTIEPFSLDETYVHLSDGAPATPIPVGDDFWARIGQRTDLHDGRLLMVSHQNGEGTHWEMHPAGDEILFLISGAMSVVLEQGRTKRRFALKPGEAFIVPRGFWHTVTIQRAGKLLSITRAAGTEVRDG